jgi:hypothetical protein
VNVGKGVDDEIKLAAAFSHAAGNVLNAATDHEELGATHSAPPLFYQNRFPWE